MDVPPKTLCAKCYNVVKSNFIACHICRAKYHFICANIDEKLCELFKNNKNIVFNCDECLNVSHDVVANISSISSEVRELKKQIIETTSISKDVKEMKQKINDLASSLENSKIQQKLHSSKQQSTMNANLNKHTINNAVAGSNVNINHADDDVACSSVNSFPTAASNLYESENEWRTVSRRKRRQRFIAVGDNESSDLAVVPIKKYLHISSFEPSVTTEQIIQYIEKKTEIGKHHFQCTRLVKKDIDIKTLKHVNFKLSVPQCFYDEIVKPSLWPVGIRLRPFVFFQRKPTELPLA